jgi:hypothetical protein
LEGALDPELSKTRAYIAVLADYQLGFTLLDNLQWVDQELRPGNPIRAWMVAFGGEVRTNSSTPDVFVFKEDKGALFKRLYLPRVLVTEIVMAYEQDCNGDYAHTFVLDPTIEDHPSARVRMALQVCWQIARRRRSVKKQQKSMASRTSRPHRPQNRPPTHRCAAPLQGTGPQHQWARRAGHARQA